MNKKNAEELLRKYRLGILTEEERDILESWYLQQSQQNPDFDISEEELNKDLFHLTQKVIKHDGPKKTWYMRNYFRISLIAASLVFILSVMAFYTMHERDSLDLTQQEDTNATDQLHIVPGNKMAVLTLANNTQIILDTSANGAIGNQTGIQIHRTELGKIVYTVVDQQGTSSTEVQYNTISTPSGGEYEVQLADGTKVWMNSLSYIRFPTKFQGNKREVEVSGEVYFEVNHNPKMPFHVIAREQHIVVLGTHFNVNAYDRDVKTTLLEGSVKVGVEGKGVYKVLKPGNQSILSAASGNMRIMQVDLEQVLAWKSGYFIFDNDDLPSVMRQIERWYDVEVDYVNTVKHIKLGGAISRKRNLKDVLDLLEMSANINFKVIGRRIVVTQ